MTDAARPTSITPLDAYKQLREELSYEANLIVQRTAWFIASQAFLFTALTVGIDRNIPNSKLSDSLLWPMIPILSLLVCTLTFASVAAAIKSSNAVRTAIESVTNADAGIKGCFPTRSKMVRWFGLAPSVVLPIAFGIAWLLILVG